MNTLRLAWVGLGIGVLVVVTLLLSWKAGEERLGKQLTDLKEKAAVMEREKDQQIGEARANEKSARLDQEKALAMVDEYRLLKGEARAIDDKMLKGVQSYEKAKEQLGDCGDVDECRRALRKELCAAGIKTACFPD